MPRKKKKEGRAKIGDDVNYKKKSLVNMMAIRKGIACKRKTLNPSGPKYVT
jgi:hypothetical protein